MGPLIHSLTHLLTHTFTHTAPSGFKTTLASEGAYFRAAHTACGTTTVPITDGEELRPPGLTWAYTAMWELGGIEAAGKVVGQGGGLPPQPLVHLWKAMETEVSESHCGLNQQSSIPIPTLSRASPIPRGLGEHF